MTGKLGCAWWLHGDVGGAYKSIDLYRIVNGRMNNIISTTTMKIENMKKDSSESTNLKKIL